MQLCVGVCVCVHYRAVQWDVNAEGGGGMGHYFQMSHCEEKYPSNRSWVGSYLCMDMCKSCDCRFACRPFMWICAYL